MSRIVILDTGIHPVGLHCKSFHSYKICSDKGISPTEPSHGTICASVLDRFAGDYELISIQVMPQACDADCGKPMGMIEHLQKGLLCCMELHADIVCMSAVSSVLSDSVYLYDAAKKLSEQSVILAALDNRRFFTIPTGYPFVAGVQADRGKVLQPGGLACKEEDAFLANIYANCDIELLRSFGHSPSNSFAVPVAAARINDWINQGLDVSEALRRLPAYPACGGQESYFWEKMLRRDLPVVVISGTDDSRIYGICQGVMDELLGKSHVEAAALCSMDGEYDVRFRKLISVDDMMDELLFMEYHYKIDMIILAVRACEREAVLDRLDADVEVRVSGESACLLYEDSEVKSCVCDLGEQIYDILK